MPLRFLAVGLLALSMPVASAFDSVRAYIVETALDDDVAVTLQNGEAVRGKLAEVSETSFALWIERYDRDGRRLPGKLKKTLSYDDIAYVGDVEELDVTKRYLLVDLGHVVPKLGGKFTFEPQHASITESERSRAREGIAAHLGKAGFVLIDDARGRNTSFGELLLFGRNVSVPDNAPASSDVETMTITGSPDAFADELNRGAREGYRLRAETLDLRWVDGFMRQGQKPKSVLEAVVEKTDGSVGIEYAVLATLRSETLQEEIDEKVAEGYEPVAICWQRFEKVAVLERPDALVKP